MPVDEERLLRKMAYVREQVTAINELLKSYDKEVIVNDPWKFRGVKYSLQTAIEALIDMAYHVAAKKYNHAPTDARDALKTLSERGVISEDDFHSYSAMVGLRNRLVHGYEEVSPERLYEIISSRLGDFEKFNRVIAGIISKEGR